MNSGRKEIFNMGEYDMKTTFWHDFSIADVFGVDAVRDTYNRAFEEWKENYIYLTELVLVLNWKIWQHNDKNNKLAEIYDELWMKADMYACENLHGDELTYFFDIID